MTRSSRVYLMRAKIECWLFENGINRIPATLGMGVRSGRVREWQSGRVREFESSGVRECFQISKLGGFLDSKHIEKVG